MRATSPARLRLLPRPSARPLSPEPLPNIARVPRAGSRVDDVERTAMEMDTYSNLVSDQAEANAPAREAVI